MKPIDIKSAEHYHWGNGCDGWHLVKNESLSVIEENVPAGEEEVRHYHVTAQQFFYVLSGSVVIELDGDRHVLEKGMGLHVPKGLPHLLKNVDTEDVRFLVVSQPMSHGDRVEVSPQSND
ncbi:MAG: cupin domain-containing protein [Gammaproteobacteria bacterium]|nr:cupin domain-containing protein [Gammaproteobacteria bacterium]